MTAALQTYLEGIKADLALQTGDSVVAAQTIMRLIKAQPRLVAMVELLTKQIRLMQAICGNPSAETGCRMAIKQGDYGLKLVEQIATEGVK